MAENPFAIPKDAFHNAAMGLRLLGFFRRPLERLSGLAGLQEIYTCVSGASPPREEFAFRALEALGVDYEVSSGFVSSIPREGPCILVANHPFGGIEGVILIDLLRKIRPDFAIMANSLLGRIEELRHHFLLVDPFGGEGSQRRNIEPLRRAVSFVRDGGLLAIFPAGTVSHLQMARREISDPEWSPIVGRIIRKTNAPVVPVFFSGTNSAAFQIAGLIHPLLRTALLPREMLRRRGSTIRLRIGKRIDQEKLHSFPHDQRLMAYLRLRTYILADPAATPLSNLLRRITALASPKREEQPVVKECPSAELEREIQALPKHQLLLGLQPFKVYYATAAQVPHVLQEIGRLREVTFRDAKEGTGRPTDLDRFDNYYVHLFVWDERAKLIVGAYRLGKTDSILRKLGKRGLYTSTLFKYRASFVNRLHPALELGRSFIRREYQKNYSALLLLWRGIGHYVVRNPRYRILFGPVSINSNYESVSRQLIINFLEEENFDESLSKMIKAKHPLRYTPIRGVDANTARVVVKDLKDVSELLDEIESTQKTVPVLLRQYLRMGGKLLGFNVDKSFANCLDGLLVVDLVETEPKLLERYLGKEGSQEFLDFHRKRRQRRGARKSTVEDPR